MRIERGWMGLLGMCAICAISHMPTAVAKSTPRFRALSEQAAIEFFGERRQPIFFDDTLARQFALGISGGVEEKRALAGGGRFVATCRPRNCEDKAAAVIGHGGRLVGVGMVGFGCRQRGEGVAPCDIDPSAFVFVRRTAGEAVLNVLSAWAAQRLARSTRTVHSSTVVRSVVVQVLD